MNDVRKIAVKFFMAAAILASSATLTGCRSTDIEDYMEEENDIQTPEATEQVEEDAEQPQEPQYQIIDSERSPETVLATVQGEDILLQDLYDEFENIPEHQRPQVVAQQHRLLEAMIQQRLLIQKANEHNIQETETFQEMYEEFQAMPIARQLDDSDVKEAALMEALLEVEIIQQMDISQEQIQELYNQYQHMMPEEATIESLEPQLRRMIEGQYVEEYLQTLYLEADIDMNEEWLREKEDAAQQPALQ